MTIKQRLKREMISALKEKEDGKEKLSAIRLILSEFDRISSDITDDQCVKVLKKTEKLEKENLERDNLTNSCLLSTIQSHLPKQVSEEDIKKWIGENVDFSTLRNKMQAIGLVKKQFGSLADGNLVKNIVQTWEC